MSKDNKRKWEKEYEDLKDKNIDQEIKKLNTKIKRLSGKEIEGTNPQEYRKNKLESEKQINDLQNEVERLGKIKENLPQVERTVKFRDAQKQRLEKLNQDKKAYEASLQETKKLSDEAQKLEDELAKLREQETKINEALKSPNLSDEKRKKLEQARIQNTQKQTQNHNDFSDNQKKLSLKLNNPLPKRDFDKEIQATKNMISKSNFICRNLMEGKKMEEISVDLKNWKNSRFTDKTNETKNITENTKTTDSEKTEIKKEEDRKVEEIDKAVQEQIKEQEEIDNKPVKVSVFDEKHPRLEKIKNFFKNAYSTVAERISGFRKKEEIEEELEIEEKEPEVEENNVPENKEETKKEPEGKLTSEQIADRKAEFYKRLAQTGKMSQLPNNSKLAESMKQLDETKKKIDEGR